ncbi:MAG: colicin uptake protein TolQ [Firmicutes bacterium]|nr:colicin uptake protein TolQ [Bacillota bacterium]
MIEFFSHTIALFNKGGLVMYPLLICSVIVIAIAVERWIYFSQTKTSSRDLLELQQQLQAGELGKTAELCQLTPGSVAELVQKALALNTMEQSRLEQAMARTAMAVVAKLRGPLNYLDTIITLAPLLGLLGTVTGMIQSFSVLNIKTGQPQAITGGVGEALIATAYGLCVAILALVIHSYFTQRLEKQINDMEQTANCLLDSVMRLNHELK